MPPNLSADEIIERLGLILHPEGGHYRETHRDAGLTSGGRACSTAIYFLLRSGERSRWHRVDATEIWHWYAGAPLQLWIAEPGSAQRLRVLGPELASGAEPQLIVPAGHWQSAATTGEFTLVGCTVSPGFEFSGFELAPATFAP